MRRVFLLSPADCRGPRARMLLAPSAAFDLARRIQDGGAPIGDVFAFLSALYFRGKLAYARAFARPAGVLVITPGEGLLSADTHVDRARLLAFGDTPVDADHGPYVEPLRRDARALDGEVVLLGSIATAKYVEPLLEILGPRLLFPGDFVGRGDMSRGGLLLRAVEAARELDYVPLAGAVRHGARPPKLAPKAR